MKNEIKDEYAKELVAYGLEMQEVGFNTCILMIESIAEKMRNKDYTPLFNINVLIETLKEIKKRYSNMTRINIERKENEK